MQRLETVLKKEVQATISKEKVSLYNDNFQKFIVALQASDRTAIDGLISEKVKEIVTDDVLKKVKDGIDPNKKLEVLKAGYYKTMDGINHPSIKYKYAGESSKRKLLPLYLRMTEKFLGIALKIRLNLFSINKKY